MNDEDILKFLDMLPKGYNNIIKLYENNNYSKKS